MQYSASKYLPTWISPLKILDQCLEQIRNVFDVNWLLFSNHFLFLSWLLTLTQMYITKHLLTIDYIIGECNSINQT